MNQERKEQPQPEQANTTDNRQEIAENPNPRANENIRHTPFEEKDSSDNAVGTEITDGEAG